MQLFYPQVLIYFVPYFFCR